MPIPPLFYPPFDTLPSLIQSTFKSAVEKEQISVFSAESSSVHHGVGAFDHTIFVVPELSDKPPAPHSTPDLSKKPDKDPFDGPSFEEGQSIADIGEHYLLTNSNAMREEHFMMISKGAFRPQAGTLEEKDLSAAYALVTAYKRQGRPLLCFFNGGPYAGASQPHLHIQFIPFVDGHPPGAEKLAQEICAALPSGQPALLPTPHVHYALRLPPSPSPSQLNESYQALLSLFRAGVKSLPDSQKPSDQDRDQQENKRDSYNLLLTTSHLALIPRVHDACIVPHPRSKAAAKTEKAKEEVSEEMTFNGMTYAGIWFVASEAERDDLLAFGCNEVLKQAGYPRTDAWSPKL